MNQALLDSKAYVMSIAVTANKPNVDSGFMVS